MSFKPIIHSKELGSLVPVDDEIFLELRECKETRFLLKTCYEIAVLDCMRITEDSFILRVRPDMRTLLLSQLGATSVALRLYATDKAPDHRYIFSGRMAIRFTEWSSQDDRRAMLREYFPSRADDPNIVDGMFPLGPERARDLRRAVKELGAEESVIQASPVILAIPSTPTRSHPEDLLDRAQEKTQAARAVKVGKP